MSTFAEAYRAPALVSLGYVLIYYAFIVNVLRVRLRLAAEYAARNERFDRYFSQDRQMLAADRMQLNMLEHMPPFLLVLWLDALCSSPTRAAIAGSFYLGSRVLYPFLIGTRLGRSVRTRILFATAVGYAVIAFLSIDAAVACLRS